MAGGITNGLWTSRASTSIFLPLQYQLDESRHFFGLGGVQRQVKVCQVIFMCLVRKAVAPLEHNLLLVFRGD